MSSIKISVDQSEWRNEIDRLSHVPSRSDLIDLEARLSMIYGIIEGIVHVETGSLKSTGQVKSSLDRATRTWQGGFYYGGPAPGQVNDPVYYAACELARGGEHFFFDAAYAHMDKEYMMEQMLNILSGHDLFA